MKRLALICAAFATIAIVGVPAASSDTTPASPDGATAIALDGRAVIAWEPATGASTYAVYRGSDPNSITTLVSPTGGVTSTSFNDTTAANGTTYYYDVTAIAAGAESAPSDAVQVTPLARSCSSGNAVVVENCYPGTTNWKMVGAAQPTTGIEGFATQTSIDAGDSVDLKVNTGNGAPYHIEIYRTGYYGGAQARLISVLPGLSGVLQPFCQKDLNTGLIDCSNWSTTSTITTTADWPSGVYLLRLVREDNGADNHILLVVRNDGASSQVLYEVPVTTYQAYNKYGGKSLYDWNSSGSNTVAGTPRAVKVSFDRPYNQTLDGERDWYTYSDIQNVSWLEQQGYDISYITSLDLQTAGSQLTAHEAVISPAHDEYWSGNMRSAFQSARNAGTSLLYLGSNADYWRIRFEASPYSGAANRVQVCYKTTQSGPDDPSGTPTGTWRDPNGANQPENALVGQMYVGDNDNTFFPMVVSADQGQNRVWRYTTLASLAPGTSARLGQNLVGWEWDSRVANGQEPTGVTTVAASPVNGEILQDAGRVYANGSATANATVYQASSGALVFATGTQHWSRGLAYNMRGVGEPNPIIQQATVNVLADMGARPTTPSSGIVLDQPGAPTVTQTSPASGASGVNTTANVTATFDRSLDPSSVTTQTFALRDANGNAVSASVAYNSSTKVATLDPTSALQSGVTYTATLSTGIRSLGGTAMAAPYVFSFTTQSLTVVQTSPADGATGVSPSAITATFSQAVDPATVTAQTFTLTDSGGNPVAASVTYNSSTLTATLTPNSPLRSGTSFTGRLTTGIATPSGSHLASPYTFSFTTRPLSVTQMGPASGATNVGSMSTVTATFSTAVDASTVTTQTFGVVDAGGNAVAGNVGYNSSTLTATFTPSAPLQSATQYTATVTTGVRGSDGSTLSAPATWSFTTASCPCSLFSATATPATLHLPVRDGRSGTGPWSYELGVKVQVTSPSLLTAIRYYKDGGETGTHVGRVWSATGTLLTQTTFVGETASGWQQQALATPITLVPGQTYVVSVGFNAFFVMTQLGLQSQITSGPLQSVADGKNGVYGSAAGLFPTQSYKSTNYFVDAVVK